ncbi:hypothetical protein GBF38_008707 [Nibea albiflora]|uniref:Uncharacterized protein n=1 Tax=Nibea albiflora TaxID=240163 RepID=A0ACB7ERA3_NIBAL|nr:hypothetical protein GBF38_008707 [Nibea albiflora]
MWHSNMSAVLWAHARSHFLLLGRLESAASAEKSLIRFNTFSSIRGSSGVSITDIYGSFVQNVPPIGDNAHWMDFHKTGTPKELASQVCESPQGRRAMSRHLERREHLKRLSLDSSIPEYMDANKCIDELLKQLEEERRNVRSGLSVTSIRSHGPILASPAIFCLLEQMAFLCDPFHTLEDEEG